MAKFDGIIRHAHKNVADKHIGKGDGSKRKSLLPYVATKPGALHHRNATVNEIMTSLSAAWLGGFTAMQNQTTKKLLPFASNIYDFAGYFTKGEPDALSEEERKPLMNWELGYHRLLQGPKIQIHIHRGKRAIAATLIALGTTKFGEENIDVPKLLIVELQYFGGRWFGVHEWLYKLGKGSAVVTVTHERLRERAGQTVRALFYILNFMHLQGPLRYTRSDNPLPKPEIDEKPEPTAPRDPPEEQVLYVNRPRYIRVQGAEPGASGRTQSGHEREGHWVTSKTGTRFWRKRAKVKGGWPDGKAPRIRRVVLAAPIREAEPQG